MKEILQHLDNAQNELNMARALLEGEEKPFARITNAYWQNGKIVVEFEANVDIDIIFGFGDKVFSVENNVGEIDQSAGSFTIGVNKHDKPWWVQLVGEVETERVNVGPFEKETYNFLHSLWDSHNYGGDEFNMEKTTSLEKAKEIIAKGKHCIFSFSGRWEDDGNKKSRQQWESMIRWMSDWVSELDPEKTLILIQDEPQHFGYTDEEIEFLYTTFKESNPNYKFGYSLTRNAVRNKVQKGFKTDFAMLPLYLFSGETTKEEFDSYFDEHIRIAREKMDAELFVIGQGFYNSEGAKQDWTEPPIGSVRWYAEAIERNDLKGLIWYVYHKDADHTIGLDEMELWDEVKALNQNIAH